VSTPYDPEPQPSRPALEPTNVLPRRRTGALSELVRLVDAVERERRVERDEAIALSAAETAPLPPVTEAGPPPSAAETAPFPPAAETAPPPLAADTAPFPPAAESTPPQSATEATQPAWTPGPNALAWTTEDDTQELPPVMNEERPGPRRKPRAGDERTPWLRRAALAVAAVAIALAGFSAALLLTWDRGSTESQAKQPPAPSASAPAAPPTAADPDGPGVLRQGATGPEVTELQERLRKIPDVYRDGATSGEYDATLTEAVARFQLWYGIRGDETGVYGNDTRRDLESRTAS
jgi:hypothetical protein